MLALLCPSTVAAGDAIKWHVDPAAGWCGGNCGVAVYGGKYVDTPMRSVFGLKGFTAPWNWDLDEHYILATALSRRLLSIYALDIEPEVGVAQRFGGMHETEAWAALYFRWTAFPWNDVVRTTIGISTGLTLTSGVNKIEEARGEVPGGSRLLHFLSPEITFALPDRPDVELMVRFHHRSGGGDFLLGDTEIFKGVTGGAQFITTGLRYRF
jgi:hypothetical protein